MIFLTLKKSTIKYLLTIKEISIFLITTSFYNLYNLLRKRFFTYFIIEIYIDASAVCILEVGFSSKTLFTMFAFKLFIISVNDCILLKCSLPKKDVLQTSH